ncbi:hypothetical protein [Streptomyces cinereospinus]|uniref:Uncharacterized protein n=1 Tax=Streptomyces cinereospinus TaxID=285561 RepID=A0ABV5N2L3_9ACTN
MSNGDIVVGEIIEPTPPPGVLCAVPQVRGASDRHLARIPATGPLAGGASSRLPFRLLSRLLRNTAF